MNIIVLRTNADNRKKMKIINSRLAQIPGVVKWTVDQEDVDKVLRIETSEKLGESAIIRSLSHQGLQCDSFD